MLEYNRVELGKEAQKYGFVRDTFEKVLRLKEILKFFNEHEYLSEHLVLKGGTAINTVIFDFLPPHTRDFSRELGGFFLEKTSDIW